jgi:hypothetical protein
MPRQWRDTTNHEDRARLTLNSIFVSNIILSQRGIGWQEVKQLPVALYNLV